MIKIILILILKIYSFYANDQIQTSPIFDGSECFLANNLLYQIDVQFAEQTEANDQLMLTFNTNHFYLSCYNLEAYFKKENLNFQIESPKIVQGKGSEEKISQIQVKLPVYELQSICIQNSRRTNLCYLVLQVYLKNTNAQVANIQIHLEVGYNFRNPSEFVYIRSSNTYIEITNIRSRIFIKELENQNNISKIKASYQETYQIDQYYPIQIDIYDPLLNKIENSTVYDAQSNIFNNFKSNKYINMNFTNYPTKFILSIFQGSTLYLNIDSNIIPNPKNNTKITLIGDQLNFKIDSSFEAIQEMLLVDKYTTIKTFFRVKYTENESLVIQRLLHYENDEDLLSFNSIFNIKNIQKNQILIIICSIIFISVFTITIIIKRQCYKQNIIKSKLEQKITDENPGNSPKHNTIKSEEQYRQMVDLEK